MVGGCPEGLGKMFGIVVIFFFIMINNHFFQHPKPGVNAATSMSLKTLLKIISPAPTNARNVEKTSRDPNQT